MIGQTVSHYRILQKIGAGGMGEIYLAEDTKLERQVALKFLPRHLTEEKEARTRFEREAKAAAALNHPNIVTVYEIGEHDDQVFIAMEYVAGKTLKDLISSYRPPSTVNRTPIPLVLDIATQIASGLAAAHAKGIIHRDIKPQNIVIDEGGRVKILDFGLAKLKGTSPLTKESFTYGTVHYMSPEQGLGKEIDARTDIWSLGVVLYEMLAGTPPFHGEYEQAVIYAIVNEETPPLPEAFRQECPGLENVIRRCLAKRREDRCPSAAELTADLQGLRPEKKNTRPERAWRSRLLRRTFPAAVLLLLVAALGFILLLPRASAPLRRALGLTGIPDAKHVAVLPLLTNSDAENIALADGFTAVIIDKLTWLEKFHDSMWTVPASDVFQLRGKSPPSLQRLWGCNLFISGDLRAEKNSLRLALKLQDGPSGRTLKSVVLQGNMANLSIFQEGLLPGILDLLELPAKPGAERHVGTGGTSLPGAYILFLKGRGLILSSPQNSGIDRGIGLLKRALQQENRYLQARLALVEALVAKYRLSKDPAWLRQAEDQEPWLRQAASQWAPMQLAWALLLGESGKKGEALTALQGVLRLDDRCYRGCIELANAYQAENKTGEAEKYYKQAIRLRPAYPKAYENLAYFYNLNGRYDEALEYYKKVTELAPGYLNGFLNTGSMYIIKGDRENAIRMFERANAIQQDTATQSNLAILYFFEGDYRKALPLFRSAAQEADDHIIWGNLADTYRQLPDQRHKASAAYQKAIALAEALLAADPGNSEVLSSLARYYGHQGEKNKAMAAITRARSLAAANLEIIRQSILVYESVQERSMALAALREYRERLGGLERIENEPDLAALHLDPEYQRMIHEEN